MLNAYLKTYLYTHLAGPFQCECHPLPQSTSLCPDLLPIVFHFGIYLFLRITYSTTQTAGQNFWLLALAFVVFFFRCCFIVFLRTYLALQREEHNSCFRTFFFLLFCFTNFRMVLTCLCISMFMSSRLHYQPEVCFFFFKFFCSFFSLKMKEKKTDRTKKKISSLLVVTILI